ncbi:glycoside hydrolase family 25 protein [Lachnospira multipara]|uniref:Lyzozyme M1 (1,4-beta-N-acetylmuramidase), GH25 family n=1 Tax=Lachnospira multipara TaxID=28051 RepID=A0A1H5U243_9FIRM|nr:glycoside hydrolase family 25 protein [Lachnospira multipara]SEF69174.1 Lyzozyme M1 (1,4-beta-N-acetylmuramidase), GH25 family [Lachnospira multipara]
MNKNSKKIIALIASLVAVILVLVAILVRLQLSGINVFTTKLSKDKENEIKTDGREELLEEIKESYNDGYSTSQILKSIFTKNVVYLSNNRYNFAEINNNLAKSIIDNDKISIDDKTGYYSYEDDKYESVAGVDLSVYQGDVDFSKVKNAGFDYCMLRVGYRTYGGGVVTADANFETYVSDALKNDLDVGVYFFTSAISTAEAKEEAQFVLDAIKPYNITYPVVVDVEEIVSGTSRQESLSVEELTEIVKIFCETIEDAGYDVMIYSNLKGFIANVNLEELEDYDKWFANYDTTPYYPYKFTMWQYSQSGSVDGIDGDVDLDIYLKEK